MDSGLCMPKIGCLRLTINNLQKEKADLDFH